MVRTGQGIDAALSIVHPEWLEALRSAQVDDGGFSQTPGAPPNTEATALAVLALETLDGSSDTVRRGRRWLRQTQQADGSWPVLRGVEDGSWVTPWALLALLDDGNAEENIDRGTAWLIRRQGRRTGWLASLLLRFTPVEERADVDPTLVGWPWHRDSFSWVEPTSLALFALKKMRARLGRLFPAARVAEGERLLYDRECRGGGWNYGNRAVLGEDLPPYPDSTAIALIALQDQPRERNQPGLRALRELLRTPYASGLALALATICFSLYGEDVESWRRRLIEAYRRAGFFGEARTLALALLATTDNQAFEVG